MKLNSSNLTAAEKASLNKAPSKRNKKDQRQVEIAHSKSKGQLRPINSYFEPADKQAGAIAKSKQVEPKKSTEFPGKGKRSASKKPQVQPKTKKSKKENAPDIVDLTVDDDAKQVEKPDVIEDFVNAEQVEKSDVLMPDGDGQRPVANCDVIEENANAGHVEIVDMDLEARVSQAMEAFEDMFKADLERDQSEDEDESEGESEPEDEANEQPEQVDEVNEQPEQVDESVTPFEQVEFGNLEFNLLRKYDRNEATAFLLDLGKKTLENYQRQAGIQSNGGTRILGFGSYILGIDEKTEETLWSQEFYSSVNQHHGKKNKWSNNFRCDFYNHPKAHEDKLKRQVDAYKLSNMDMGHMSPAANHKSSRIDCWSTYIASNAVPTSARTNRKVLCVIEAFFRELAENSTVAIFTGGERASELVCEQRRVCNFFKSVLVVQNGELVSYSFKIPHEDIKLSKIKECICSIEEIESSMEIKLFTEIERSKIKQVDVNTLTGEGLFDRHLSCHVRHYFMKKRGCAQPLINAMFDKIISLSCCVCKSKTPGAPYWLWTHEKIPRRICEKDRSHAKREKIYLDEAGVKQVEEWRKGVVTKDRSHPDMWCCVCKSKAPGASYWNWTKEKISRRVCRNDYDHAWKKKIYLDEAGVKQVEEWRKSVK